jgi:hypothetical protein
MKNKTNSIGLLIYMIDEYVYSGVPLTEEDYDDIEDFLKIHADDLIEDLKAFKNS